MQGGVSEHQCIDQKKKQTQKCSEHERQAPTIKML